MGIGARRELVAHEPVRLHNGYTVRPGCDGETPRVVGDEVGGRRADSHRKHVPVFPVTCHIRYQWHP